MKPLDAPGHSSLKDIAVDYIREAIVSGRQGPGSKVDQDEIAAALGMSRLPVREALIELAHKGFVVTIPRRGAFVVELKQADIEDHFEVVGMIFALAARRAAKLMEKAELDELQQLHEQITASDDPETSDQLNRRFVRIINHAGSSRLLRSMLDFVAGALPGSLYATSPEAASTEAVYRERMLAALKAHDAEQAASVAQEHLRTCEWVTIEALRDRGYWAQDEESGDGDG